MKALFVGGTGTISTAVTALAVERGWDLTLLNRGTRSERLISGVQCLTADINGDEGAVSAVLSGHSFDVVVDFIAFVPGQLERDIRLFSGRTSQFIFISSASAYQKPLNHYAITESTPLSNPYWEYSRNKIACEDMLMAEYRRSGFPVTIVRPSHTYSENYLPVAVHGRKGSWQVVDRILKGKPVLVHGDGTSLWTLTHSRDFAKGFLGLMGNPLAIGETVHITGDESLTWNGIYDRLGSALGMPVSKYHVSSDFLAACDPDYAGTLGGDKAWSVVFDNTKLKRLVPDFVPVIRFDQGVRECVRFIMEDQRLQTPDPDFDRFCDTVIAALEGAKASFFADTAHRQ